MSAALLQAAAHVSAQESSASPVNAEHEDDTIQSDGEGEDDGEHENDAGHEDAIPNGTGEKRKKRSRACQACRGMKIRCLPVEGQDACKACSKVGRACIMPGPARKRQKTVHKVAELEKKIDALTKSLAAKNASTQDGNGSYDYPERRQSAMTQSSRGGFVNVPTPPSESPRALSTPSIHARPYTGPSIRTDRDFNLNSSSDKGFTNYSVDALCVKPAGAAIDAEPVSDYVDVITRGIMTIERATEIFDRWKLEMCPSGPFVAFSEHATIHWLRQKRPMVLLAILGVACGTIQPELQADLMVELARQLADRVMFLYEKSVDLAQAMLIMPLWYGKHKNAKDLGFNQYIHSAVTMCLDLGLGKRSRKACATTVEEDLERRRLWLGCYFMAGNVTTVLRLPSLVKYSPYIEECLEYFATSPAALPTDRWLCSLVRLMHMYEDIGLLFHMDDPGSIIPLNDTRTQYHFKMFERQLEDWKKMSENLVPKALLDQYAAVTSLYIHEIAMHSDHNVDDFTPKAMTQLTSLPNNSERCFLANEHFEALTICVDSMEAAMVAFESIDLRILRGLPCLNMVWIAYVGVAMIRLHGLLKAPDSKYGYIFLPKMRVEHHLDNCIARLTLIVSENSHSPAEAFLISFKKLRAWFALRNAEAHLASLSHDSNGHAVYKTTKQAESGNNYDLPYSPSSSIKTSPNQYGGSMPQAPLHQSLQSQSNSTQALPQYDSSDQSTHRSMLPHQRHMANRVSNLLNHAPTTEMNVPNTGSLLDPNTTIDASTFDIAWDLDGINTNLNELNNFDTYMYDVGWMGYLL